MTTPPSRLSRIAARLYHAALLAYPRAFRRAGSLTGLFDAGPGLP